MVNSNKSLAFHIYLNSSKIITGLLLCFVLVSFSYPQSADANLILNGDFETGIQGWVGGIHEFAVVYKGSGSLKVQDASSTQDITGQTTDQIPIEAHQGYYLEMRIRGAQANQKVQVVVGQWDNAGNWISGGNKLFEVTVGQKWSLFRTDLEDWKHETAGVSITLRPTPYLSNDPSLQGTAYFDEIYFNTYSTNLIGNPGFELGTTGWTGTGTPTTTSPHSGSYALKVEDNSSKSINIRTGFIPVFSDKTYLFDTWVRGTVSGQGMDFFISQYNSEREHIKENNIHLQAVAGSQWTRVAESLTLHPEAHYVSITLNPCHYQPANTGTAYFDDVRFRVFDGNLILNSGFEYDDAAWTGESYEIDDAYADSGTYSLHIVDASSDKNITVSTQDLIPVFPEGTYLIQAWIRGLVSGQDSLISIGQYDQDGNWISGKNIASRITTSTSGTSFHRVIRDLNPKTAFVKVSLNPVMWTSSGDKTGEAWFDDVRFYQYSGNLIENGSFERGTPESIVGWEGDGEQTSVAFRGNFSLEIDDDSYRKNLSATTQDIIPIAHGEVYSFSAWVRTDYPTDPPHLVLGQYAGEENSDWLSGKNLSYSADIRRANEWTCFQTFVRDFDPSTEAVRPVLYAAPWTSRGENEAIAQFDEVRFQLVTEPEGVWLPGTGDVQLWWAPPDEKIQRGLSLSPNASTASAVSISAARGESESFQIVLLPSSDTQLVSASISDMRNGSNIIPSSQVVLREVAYVPIENPTDAGTFPGCELPDPLPLLGSINLSANLQQPIWVTVTVPDDIAPGIYNASLSLNLNGGTSISVPINLKVWDFALPDEHHLRTSYGFSMGQMRIYHELGNDVALQKEMLRRYLDEFARARISPTNPVGNDWYKVIFWNLNWSGGEFVQDPVETLRPNNVLLVHDNNDSVARVDATAFIDIDTSKSYTFSWDVYLDSVNYTWDPVGTNYSIVISQYDDKDNWISGGNMIIDGDVGAGRMDRWVPGFSQLPVPGYSWTPGVASIQIRFMAREWDNPGDRGAAYFDHLSIFEDGIPLTVQNAEMDPVAPEDLEIRLETSAFDEAAQYAFDLGFDSIALYLPFFSRCSMSLDGCTEPSLLDWKWDSTDTKHVGGYSLAYQNVIRAIRDHMESKNWLDKAYTYWADEPAASWFAEVEYGMDILGKGAPDLKNLITLNHDFSDTTLQERIEIWVPQIDEFDAGWARDRQAAGDEVWWYVSTGVRDPYSNNFIDYPGIDLRARIWSAWKYDMDGSLYWQTNYWTNDGSCYDSAHNENNACPDPWTEPMSYTEPEPDGSVTPFGNGGGVLFYPPKNWKSTSGVTDPIPSIRLELIREGLEDFEYFWMLNNALDQCRRTGVCNSKEVSKAEDLLSISPEIILSLTQYSHTVGDYLGYREELAMTLEKLMDSLPVTPTPTATPLISPTPTGTMGIHMPTSTPSSTPTPSLVTITPSPTPIPTNTPTLVNITPTATPFYTSTPTPTPTLVTATPSVTPASTLTFIDVHANHWAYEDIVFLYDRGYVAGCSEEPLAYCPEEGMKRDEASVFVVRGVNGADVVPSDPTLQVFADVNPGTWHSKWIKDLEEGGYTEGCGVNEREERIFCPYDPHTRAEATVFFLRMLHGADYVPPPPVSERVFLYQDVPMLTDVWYVKWIYAAYDAGLVDGCEDVSNHGDTLFRPGEVITRSEAACMMARAVRLQ